MAALNDLIVWRRSVELMAECYRISAKFPREEMYGMTSQLRRAALSVSANIAEGNGRQSPRQFLQFLAIARGSLKEVETYLAACRILEYGSDETLAPANRLAEEVSRMMTGLRGRLVGLASKRRTGSKA